MPSEGCLDLPPQPRPLTAVSDLARLSRLAIEQRESPERILNSLVSWFCRLFDWPYGRLSVLAGDLPRGILFVQDRPEARYIAVAAGDEVLLDRVRLWEDLIAFRSPVFLPAIPASLQVRLAGSALGAPVLADGEVAGVIEFFSDAPREADSACLEAVQYLGVLAGQAIRPKVPAAWERRGDASLRSAFDQAPIAVALIDSETLAVCRMNSGFLKLLDRSPDDVRGRPVAEFLHRDDLHRLRASIVNRAHPVPLRHEYRFLRRDGRPLWIRGLVSAPPRAGLRRMAILMGEDVTQERNLSRVLKDAEGRSSALVRASEDSFFLLSENGEIRDWGTPPPVAARRIEDAFPPDVADAYRAEVAMALKTGQVREFSYRLPDAGGEREMSARLVASGAREGLALVRDVTMFRKIERRLREIEERQRRKLGQDLHDGLGQDLTGIALKCSALARRLETEARPELREVLRIERLVQNAIASTRALARGLCPVGLEGCGLAEHLRKLALHVRETFGVRCSVSWDRRLPDSAEPPVTDLYWILHEATTNAIRHGNPRRIRISVEREGDGSAFRVWNDGRPLEAGRSTDGMGVEVMKARAKSIGADLQIRNHPDGGVEVACILTRWATLPGDPTAPEEPAKP